MLSGQLIDAVLGFYVPIRVKIMDGRLGVVYRICQLITVIYLGLSLYLGESWAYSEKPIGEVNAWPEGGQWRSQADLIDYTTLNYCGNPSFSYAYDANFLMDDPKCEPHHPYEVAAQLCHLKLSPHTPMFTYSTLPHAPSPQITVKGSQLVAFVTAFIEMRQTAWPSTDAADTAKTSLCTARGGTLTTSGSQRQCASQRTVYPVGVDKMVLAFEHAFFPAHDQSL